MSIKAAGFADVKINEASPIKLYTRNVTMTCPDGVRVGGVDHYMKKSLKQLVTYYLRRLQRENATSGKYVVTAEMGTGMFGPIDTILNVEIIVK